MTTLTQAQELLRKWREAAGRAYQFAELAWHPGDDCWEVDLVWKSNEVKTLHRDHLTAVREAVKQTPWASAEESEDDHDLREFWDGQWRNLVDADPSELTKGANRIRRAMRLLGPTRDDAWVAFQDILSGFPSFFCDAAQLAERDARIGELERDLNHAVYMGDKRLAEQRKEQSE